MEKVCTRHIWNESNQCKKCYGYRVEKIKGDIFPYRQTKLAQATVTEGGWYHGKEWLTTELIDEIHHRWWARGQSTIVPEEATGYVLQCGGCKFFAAIGGDWGLCWNVNSPHDGRAVFEHNGCYQHSNAEKAFEEKRMKFDGNV